MLGQLFSFFKFFIELIFAKSPKEIEQANYDDDSHKWDKYGQYCQDGGPYSFHG